MFAEREQKEAEGKATLGQHMDQVPNDEKKSVVFMEALGGGVDLVVVYDPGLSRGLFPDDGADTEEDPGLVDVDNRFMESM
jgi:hypothetical protein